jgi:ribokinase
MSNNELAILGSINMDIVCQIPRFHRRGETIIASEIVQTPGGKGANQAIAAARIGGRVALIGAVGPDDNGTRLLAVLEGDGVNIELVARLKTLDTGLAIVTVADSGENHISVLRGANACVESPADFPEATVALAQLETPIEVVASFLATAKKRGMLTLLNAAPAQAKAVSIFPLADIIILNSVELSDFSAMSLDERDQLAITLAARSLISDDKQTVVVTRGAYGAIAVTHERQIAIPAWPATPIDTTGAGDCFCGILACCLSSGMELVPALGRAAAGAAIAVSRKGVSSAYPSLSELDAYMGARLVHPG